MEIEVGAPCRPVPAPQSGLYRGRLEACRSAVVVHRGPYDEIGPVYPRRFAWVNDHQPAHRVGLAERQRHKVLSRGEATTLLIRGRRNRRWGLRPGCRQPSGTALLDCDSRCWIEHQQMRLAT